MNMKERIDRIGGIVIIFLAPLLLIGCIGSSQNPAASEPATAAQPLATTQPAHWIDQAAVAGAESNDFEALVKAGERALRDYAFTIDSVDYRQGLIVSDPLIGSQFFEFWRRDNQTLDAVVDSSLATHRRIVRIEIQRLEDNRFVASPKVILERQANAEQRISGILTVRTAFKPSNPKDRPYGSKELDQGRVIPQRYWYVVGRDEALEKKLAGAIRGALR